MAKKACVLDTSIAVKWFVEEHDSKAALEIRTLILSKKLMVFAPDLMLYELTNALRWNKKFQERDVITALVSVINVGIRITPPSQDELQNAIALAFKKGLTIYDSIFLAAAICRNVVLVTGDKRVSEASPETCISMKECIQIV